MPYKITLPQLQSSITNQHHDHQSPHRLSDSQMYLLQIQKHYMVYLAKDDIGVKSSCALGYLSVEKS
jgi:hypothetical protein